MPRKVGKKQLTKQCQDYDFFENIAKAKKVVDESWKRSEEAAEETFQWLREVNEENLKRLENKTSKNNAALPPLLPQTPTLKRKLRKRKAAPPPSLEQDDEKENALYVTRSQRAASQAAHLKIHSQLNYPVKMRRPSVSESIGSKSYVKTIEPPKRSQAQRRKLKVTMQLDKNHDEQEIDMEEIKTVKIKGETEAIPEEEAHKAKRSRLELSSEATDIVKLNAIDSKTVRVSRVANDLNPCVALTSTKNSLKESVRKLSHTVQISLERLPNYVVTTVKIDSHGNISPPSKKENNVEADDEIILEEEMIVVEVDEATPPEAKSPQIPTTASLVTPAKTLEVRSGRSLQALTPHLKGLVKDRVAAVEKSLKKDNTVNKSKHCSMDTNHKSEASQSLVDIFESAESSQESDTASPINKTPRSTQLCEITSGEEEQSASSDSQRSSDCVGDSPTVSKKNTATVKKRKSTRSLVVKLFPKTDAGNETFTKHQSSSVKPKKGMGTIVTNVNTFLKRSRLEMATTIQENEQRKKEEDRQRNVDRFQDASKKKEEALRLLREEKKRINEEKRARFLHAKELKAREKKELAKQEQEKLEKQKAIQKLREEKERQEKEHRLLVRKKKQELRELKRREEEEARLARQREEEETRLMKAREAQEAAEQIRREEQARLAKAREMEASGIAVAVHPGLKGKAPAPTSKQVMSAKKALNETFEMPTKIPTGTKPKLPIMDKLKSATNNYPITPVREEPLPSKNANDYGIDDVKEDDPSDDEDQPAKQIPLWARNLNNNRALEAADWVRTTIRNRLFGTAVFRPSAKELFGENARSLRRASSAIWNTPPSTHHQSFCTSLMID